MPAGRDDVSPESMRNRAHVREDEAIFTVPVMAEELSVTRERVTTGTVRVDKRVSRRTESVDEPVMRERVEVERRPVNRVVERAPEVRQEGDTLIIPLLEEVLVVERRLVVREELLVTRVRERSRMQQEVTLESEHADVERIDEPLSAGDAMIDRRPAHPKTLKE